MATDTNSRGSAASVTRARSRILIGMVFVVLGSAGVGIDAFDADPRLAVTIVGLIGSVGALSGLAAIEVRRRPRGRLE